MKDLSYLKKYQFKKGHKFVLGGEKGWFRKGEKPARHREGCQCFRCNTKRKKPILKLCCERCKKEFMTNNNKRRFCSRRCVNKGREKTQEHVKKIVESRIRNGTNVGYWKNKKMPEYVKEKLRQARMKQKIPTKFTKPELKFMRIIRRHNLPYKFTGDGSFWIENINPDFVQTNGKKICVEVWGDYWHSNPEYYSYNKLNRTQISNLIKDNQKLNILKKYGWQRIVFWEHELKHKK